MSNISNNSIRVKQINMELVKNTLKSMEYGTTSLISSITGLSVGTCGSIIKALLQNGEIFEVEMEEPNGGRPARQYKYNADFSFAICMYVKTEGGIHSLTYALVNLVGKIILENTMTLPQIDYEVIDNQIDELIQCYDNIKAVGIGIPGVVHKGVVGVCDIESLIGVALGPRLHKKYGLKITIENDMQLSVYGFYKMQNYDEDKTYAVVTFPKDNFPGSGFVVDGHLLKGTTKFAGEISFLPFDLSREQQLASIKNRNGFIPLAIKTLTSIIAIINPISIALTGDLIKPEHISDIQKGCLNHIPEEHMPQIFLKNDIHPEYMTGLISITLESMNFNLQLIEK